MLFYKTLDFIWEKNLARLNPQITLSIVLEILGQYAGPLEPEQFKGGRGGGQSPIQNFLLPNYSVY